MKRIILIIPYFGKFHSYFRLWLDSCAKNPTVTFLIFTDDRGRYPYPPNVRVVYTTFEKFSWFIREEYKDIPAVVGVPYKLCDYRPAYGDIFSTYIKDFDFWGYCDIDLIFGDIRKLITDDILTAHDKVLCNGHFTLFKNDRRINTAYKSTGIYKTVFTTERNMIFDEGISTGMIPLYKKEKLKPGWLYGDKRFSINEIAEKAGLKIYCNFDIFADIKTIYPYMELAKFSCDEYRDKKAKHSTFIYQNGKIHRYYLWGENVLNEEFMYIHLQKRRLDCPTDLDLSKPIEIRHDRFLNFDPDLQVLSPEFLRNKNRRRFDRKTIRKNYGLWRDKKIASFHRLVNRIKNFMKRAGNARAGGADQQ